MRVNPLTDINEWFNARTQKWYPNIYRLEPLDVYYGRRKSDNCMIRLRFIAGTGIQIEGEHIMLHPEHTHMHLALDKFCWVTGERINRKENEFLFGDQILDGSETVASLSMPPSADITIHSRSKQAVSSVCTFTL